MIFSLYFFLIIAQNSRKINIILIYTLKKICYDKINKTCEDVIMPGRYYRELENIHINTCPPRAYFIPFPTEAEASLPREYSRYYTSLNGEWDFEFFDNVEELEIEKPDFTESIVCHDKMTVPFCWQLCLNRGYDVPNYINQDYPYPVDPPYLPDIIPCGFYRRKVSINKHPDRTYYINFEGVSSCYYLWINGVFKGYSQVSHSTGEFEISDLLKDGDNLFEVLVVKHCTGSYMEDQDFFRLSGIFRDVYILERPKVHIDDIFADAEVNEELSTAKVNVSMKLSGNAEAEWKFISPSGELINNGTVCGDFSFEVDSPILWNAEQPQLYTLILHCSDEYIALKTGLRRIEIRNKCFLLNGKKIKLRGINRHDSNPETGYTVSVEDMLNDLYILKRANVNTIRTSHYPNDPRFPGMCDELGFMLIDEADLESHGMGYNYGDWYWDYWAYLCDAPEWKFSCLDRAERLFERDKNHPCVIMWSLGNESGCGQNHRHMAQYIRNRDSKALIHYENARIEYQERLGKDFSDISDVESRMYASLDYLSEYLNDESMTKPFFYCEYVAAWSTGDIPLHWDEFEKYDNYCGGCVWEYCDHAVNIGTKEEPAYRFGGDFGDYPNDYVYCVDGLVYPDRRPRPGYYDMKDCYKPFSAEYGNGVLTLKNKKYFSSLDELYFEYSVETDGITVEKAVIDGTTIPPQTEKQFLLPVKYSTEKLTTLNIFAKYKNKMYFCEKDYEAGHVQFILNNAPFSPEKTSPIPLQTEETHTDIRIQSGGISFTFSKLYGKITSVKSDIELLKAPIEFSLFRSCHPSNSAMSQWKRARYDHAYQKTYSVKLERADENKAVITADISFAAAAMPPALRCKTTYTFSSDGQFNISVKAERTDNAPDLPRFGVQLTLGKEFENISYLGYGPMESYSDRYRSQLLSRFNTTVNDNFEHYVKPTESSAHYAVKTAEISDDSGHVLLINDRSEKGFSFCAKHYTDEQLLNTRHDDELKDEGITVINADYKLLADNCGDALRCPERRFDEKEFSFSYDFIFKKNGSDINETML